MSQKHKYKKRGPLYRLYNIIYDKLISKNILKNELKDVKIIEAQLKMKADGDGSLVHTIRCRIMGELRR